MSNTTVVKTRTCTVCDQYELWVLDSEAVARWQEGEYVDKAFPSMSAEEREMLITGTHPACWDKLFPKEEESDESQQN